MFTEHTYWTSTYEQESLADHRIFFEEIWIRIGIAARQHWRANMELVSRQFLVSKSTCFLILHICEGFPFQISIPRISVVLVTYLQLVYLMPLQPPLPRQIGNIGG